MFSFLFGGRTRQISLDTMHSSLGTSVFKKISPSDQQRWASYDRNMSRLRMKRMESRGRTGRAKMIEF